MSPAGVPGGTVAEGESGAVRPGVDPAVLRRLQLTIGRRLTGLLHGDYLGLLPGAGSESGESREYQIGDDVRRMDWPVTARTTVPHVRQSVADRELETWLCMDLSPSLDFGTADYQKRDLAILVATAFTTVAARGGNRVGAVVSNGAGTLRLLARSGEPQTLGLLRRIAMMPPGTPGKQLGLADAIAELHRPPRRRGLAVVVSDFLDEGEWDRPLHALSMRHDVLAVEIVDPVELRLPDVGVLSLLDPETGERHEVQTASRRLREEYERAATEQRARIASAIRGAGAAHLRLLTDSDWLLEIVRFVHHRRRNRMLGAVV